MARAFIPSPQGGDIVAIVLEEAIGNTAVRIHDDRCQNLTEEEIREILKQVSVCARKAVKLEPAFPSPT